MHIKCPENQLMYKKAKQTQIIAKSRMILLFGLICLCKQLRQEKAVYVCRFAHGGVTFRFRTTDLLEGSSGLQEAYTKSLSQFGKKNRSMLVPCHDTIKRFMIFTRVLDLQELKNQVSQPFRPSHDAEMFEFHSHFLHGTWKLTQGHTYDFSTNFGALEHVLVVQILIMHIKCPETQLRYKKGQTNPKKLQN